MSRFDRKPTNAAEKPPSEAPAPAQLDPDHIDASNEGFKMLKSMGWTEGQGLGKQGAGDALPLSERIREEARREGLGRSKQEAEMLSKATTRKRDDSDDEAAKKRRKDVGEEQRRRDEILQEQHRNFYCACCDKQYTTVSEFSAHLSSYDHHHRKRFAEMREAEKARNADATAEKRSREEASSWWSARARRAAAFPEGIHHKHRAQPMSRRQWKTSGSCVRAELGGHAPQAAASARRAPTPLAGSCP